MVTLVVFLIIGPAEYMFLPSACMTKVTVKLNGSNAMA